MEKKPTITVQNTVNVPVEKAWKTYNTPNDIMQWNNASDDWHTPKAENDLRAGGSFSYTMAAKDGSFSFDYAGIYDEIKDFQQVAYTLGDGRKVTTTFEPTGNATKVTTTFEAENQNSIELQRTGWQAILDNFKKYTENN